MGVVKEKDGLDPTLISYLMIGVGLVFWGLMLSRYFWGRFFN